jgi:hypothetical protein
VRSGIIKILLTELDSLRALALSSLVLISVKDLLYL